MNKTLLVATPENDSLLRQHSVEIESLYRQSPNGLAVVDRELRFVSGNEALAEFLETPPE
jgi:PAS domain-containing protein